MTCSIKSARRKERGAKFALDGPSPIPMPHFMHLHVVAVGLAVGDADGEALGAADGLGCQVQGGSHYPKIMI